MPKVREKTRSVKNWKVDYDKLLDSLYFHKNPFKDNKKLLKKL